MYKQRLNVKKIQNKFLNLIKLLFPWNYRFAFHSVPICLVPSTEMSSTEYRNVAYVQYRDVQVPSCPDTVIRHAQAQHRREAMAEARSRRRRWRLKYPELNYKMNIFEQLIRVLKYFFSRHAILTSMFLFFYFYANVFIWMYILFIFLLLIYTCIHSFGLWPWCYFGVIRPFLSECTYTKNIYIYFFFN